jgi:putative endonuclease
MYVHRYVIYHLDPDKVGREIPQLSIMYVYILASESGTLYIGFTTDLVKRVWEHKSDLVEGFTKKYKCHKLVYYEQGEDFDSALAREKEIKKWRREKKEKLIKTMNRGWRDLYDDIAR